MKMLTEVFAELVGMFVGDVRLTTGVLALVALSAALIDLVGIKPLIGGGVLVIGCLILLVEGTRRSSRRDEAE